LIITAILKGSTGFKNTDKMMKQIVRLVFSKSV
jgi:hypothetical protein